MILLIIQNCKHLVLPKVENYGSPQIRREKIFILHCLWFVRNKRRYCRDFCGCFYHE